MVNNPLYRLRNSSYCLAFVLLCLSPLQASAQSAKTPAASTESRWYDVELLIFKYSNPEEFAGENWPQRWSRPITKNSVIPDAIDGKYGSDFQMLAPDMRSFGGMLEKLGKSSRYEVLSHTAWRQRGLDKEQAIGMRIQAGRKYQPQAPIPADSDFGLFEQSFIEQGFVPEVTIRQYTEQHSGAQTKSSQVLHELEGEVKIVLSRFLHVYTDLLLMKPVTLTPVTDSAIRAKTNTIPEAAVSPLSGYHVAWVQAPTPLGSNKNETIDASETLYGFNIKAHRRMRSGELHHIDHPLLGILIQVKPAETAKP